jgi:hypothetical protein
VGFVYYKRWKISSAPANALLLVAAPIVLGSPISETLNAVNAL